MKIRNGFVSNSSSSSFIVAFKEVPKTAEEMKKILFRDVEHFSHPYERTGFSTKEIADIVFNDLINQKPWSKKKLLEDGICDAPKLGNYKMADDFKGINYYEIPFPQQKNNENDEEYDKKIDKWHAQREDQGNKILMRFLEVNKDCKFYVFEYCDNDGSVGCAMEHGKLFESLPHLVVSNH